MQPFRPSQIEGGADLHHDVPDDVVTRGLLLEVGIFDQVRYRGVYYWPERVAASCRQNGLREFLKVERKQIPEDIPFEADKLECEFFDGYDPSFAGDEPLGL